jgi:hypothetical protein
MGDAKKDDLRVGFDSRLKLKFCGSKVTTDAGLLAYRELDEALGLTEMVAELLTDSRLGRNTQHQLVPLLRQSIYSRLAGYEDVNDAERLAVGPVMRHVVGGRASQPDKQAASSSEVGRFETETLSTQRNLTALMKLPGRWIDNVHRSKNSSWIWTARSVRPTAGNRARPTTATLHASVTIRCFCSTSMVIWSTRCCGVRHSSAVWCAGESRLSLRRSPQSQRRIGAGNRAFAHLSGRTAFPQAQCLLSQLPISSEIMAASASRGGQD